VRIAERRSGRLQGIALDGIKAPESTELLGKVKAACGM
jgi:hypothetical protein